MLVVADRLAQIRAALAWAKEGNLKIVIGGGRDAWRAAPELAAAGVPVVLDPVIGLPTRADEPYDAPYAAPGILAKAGVRVAITEGDSQFARNLAHHASVATAYGMPRDKALEAITLEPARILGIARSRRFARARQGRDSFRVGPRRPRLPLHRRRRVRRRAPARPLGPPQAAVREVSEQAETGALIRLPGGRSRGVT